VSVFSFLAHPIALHINGSSRRLECTSASDVMLYTRPSWMIRSAAVMPGLYRILVRAVNSASQASAAM
jgi:hypothetical protein